MSVLDGRVLLTGAAGGIGSSLSRALAGRARPLVLSARSVSQVSDLASDLGAEAIACDLEDRLQLNDLAHSAGEVDLLILNAALPASGKLMEFTPDQIDRAIDVNLRAPLQLARAIGEGMVARGRGHIVFISSLAGKTGSPGTTLYSATKFGLRGASHSMRLDLAASGVGVSVVCPGFVSDAGMFADTGARLPRGVRTVTPEQVSAAVIDAVERNRTEVDVAPLSLRLAAAASQIAPGLVGRLNLRTGGAKLAERMAAAQSQKR